MLDSCKPSHQELTQPGAERALKVAACEPWVWIFNYNHVGPRSKCADPSPSNRLVYFQDPFDGERRLRELGGRAECHLGGIRGQLSSGVRVERPLDSGFPRIALQRKCRMPRRCNITARLARRPNCQRPNRNSPLPPCRHSSAVAARRDTRASPKYLCTCGVPD